MKQDIKNRLAQAEMLCQKAGGKLTALRLAILELIYKNPKQLTAYELLRLLKKDHPKAEAMTVYRGLAFLQDQKLIHRIASQNAYTACDQPHHEHHSQLLLCDGCGFIQEINVAHIRESLEQTAEHYHFLLSEKPVEISGLCKTCQQA